MKLESLRRELDSTGEVRIGAFARRQRRRRALLAVFGLLLIGGAVALYCVLRPVAESPGKTYAVSVRCTSCGYAATVEVASRQTFPLVCPQCGEKTCRELWKCRVCGHEFVPADPHAEVRCPSCGSLEVGSAAVP